MVIYNPKDWWRLIFAFHKSDTFRMMLPGIIGVAFFTGIVAYIENEVFHATFKNTTAIHGLVGFVLSLLLVFRTNTAYERWWEGRKAWGSFVNNSRNLALKLSVLSLSQDQKKIFADLISNYIYATKEHLRGFSSAEDLVFNDTYDINYYLGVQHLPNRVMKAIYQEINILHSQKIISGEQLLFLNEELRSFTDNVGICERIKRTPIPYSYSLYLKKIIFIYVFTMPIGFVREFGYWAMPIVSMVFYVFGSIELLAEEIEDPFGTDANDLPTDQIFETIKANIDEIMGS
jgi:ion channel-forming bestrophin family protein